MRSSVWLLLLSGCASAPPDGLGELGLAGLRRELGLTPPLGHVARGDDGWLVHDPTGVRIARLPTAPAVSRCLPQEGTKAIAFEGDPGAMMTFSFGEVEVWQTDAKGACTASPVDLAPPEPAWELVTELDPTPVTWDNVADLRASHLIARASLALPSGPLDILITPDSAAIRRGTTTQVLDVPKGDRCGVAASASRAQAPNGATWVLLAYTLSHQADLERCEDGVGDAQYESSGRLWLEVARDGAMRVIESEVVALPSTEELSELTRNIDLPGNDGAYLEYQESSRHSFGRESASELQHWSWILVVGKRSFLLAEDDR